MPEMRSKGMRVYIASPYTIGDQAVNVKVQMSYAHALMNVGFMPYVPLLCHFLHMANPRPYEDWIALDNAWLPMCHAVLRLPGESRGADGEVALARAWGIPVFYSLEELLRDHA